VNRREDRSGQRSPAKQSEPRPDASHQRNDQGTKRQER